MTKLVRFDWAIKYLLRNKANFDILEGFLSELLKTDIQIEEVLDSESNKNSASDKFNRVDVLVHTEKNEKIIIEVQTLSQWDYLNRMVYATSKTLTEHLKEGEPYRNISKLISVNIVFFNLGRGQDYLYRGRTEFTGLNYLDTLRLGPEELKMYPHYQTPGNIFPEYYIIKVDQFNELIKSKFDEWIYFLKTERIKPDFQAKGLQSAAQKLAVLKLPEEGRKAYDRFQDDRHTEASLTWQHNYEIKESREEGRAEGRAEGHEEGLLEGKQLGEVAMLIGLLQRKFGPLPASYRELIMKADTETLMLWAEKTLETKKLEDIFSFSCSIAIT